MIRRPPRSTLSSSSAASDVYKRQSEVGAKANASWRPPPADFCDAPPVALHRRRSEQPRTAGRLKSRVTEEPSPYRVRGRLLRAPPTTATLLTGRARGRSRGYPPTSARPPERHRPDLQRHHRPHVQPHGDRPVARPTQWGHCLLYTSDAA